MDASKWRMLRMSAFLAASLAAAPSWGQTGSAPSASQAPNAYEQACKAAVEQKGIGAGLQSDFMLQCMAGERLDHNPPKGRKG